MKKSKVSWVVLSSMAMAFALVGLDSAESRRLEHKSKHRKVDERETRHETERKKITKTVVDANGESHKVTIVEFTHDSSGATHTLELDGDKLLTGSRGKVTATSPAVGMGVLGYVAKTTPSKPITVTVQKPLPSTQEAVANAKGEVTSEKNPDGSLSIHGPASSVLGALSPTHPKVNLAGLFGALAPKINVQAQVNVNAHVNATTINVANDSGGSVYVDDTFVSPRQIVFVDEPDLIGGSVRVPDFPEASSRDPVLLQERIEELGGQAIPIGFKD